jgi:dTDP-4-dehydrorhamnose reductase
MVRSAAPQGGKILLTGATGQVGAELLETLKPLGDVIAPARAQMDLANKVSLRETIRAVRPRWIVNPAAYTAVDKAESEPELAFAINAEAVKVIGQEAKEIGAVVIHFSTDYVFDGTGTEPYRETDSTSPTSVYGATKLAGEKALAETGACHIIFRTSWVYAAQGKNFLRTILKLARERETLRVVADQVGAPTWSRDLAKMTAASIGQCEAVSQSGDLAAVMADIGGIYHAAGAGETTWFGFAAKALQLQREIHPAVRFAKIEAITAAEYPTPARRPLNSRMNCDKLFARFGWKMMDWQESLQRVSAEI